MKISKIILAVALPLALSAGCALDVGSSSDGLTTDTNNDFGINACGESLQTRIIESDWSVGTVVAGDMEFTKDDLIEQFETNPGLSSDLLAEIAGVQLDMAAGLEIPDSVLDGMIEAEEFLMAPKDDDGRIPPIVAVDDFASLQNFNRRGLATCLESDFAVNTIAEGTQDLREGIVDETPGVVDLREGLFTQDE